MKKMLFVVLLCMSNLAFAMEWGQVKSGLGGNTVDIVTSQKRVNLIWPNQVVPGEQLLLTKSTYSRYQLTSFQIYVFAGVTGNSAKINVTNVSGGNKSNDSKPVLPDSREEKTIFVERANDEAFYFVPEELKEEGFFKIERDKEMAGVYSVTIIKGIKRAP